MLIESGDSGSAEDKLLSYGESRRWADREGNLNTSGKYPWCSHISVAVRRCHQGRDCGSEIHQVTGIRIHTASRVQLAGNIVIPTVNI
jgi:hypothetical protein